MHNDLILRSNKYFINLNIFIASEKCIERCCMDHNVPMKCVEEKSESQMKSGHNSTHLVVTLVMSNECNDYQEALEMCKLECNEDTKDEDTKGKNDIFRKCS